MNKSTTPPTRGVLEQRAHAKGIGAVDALGLLFIAFKLAGIITWSWWWVTAPFWGAVILVIIGAMFTKEK